MANFPLISAGQLAVPATAEALPVLQSLPSGAVSGQGYRLILGCTKASTASLYYGPVGVTPTTGKEVPAGTSDTIFVDDPSQIYVVATSASTATATWSVTNNG